MYRIRIFIAIALSVFLLCGCSPKEEPKINDSKMITNANHFHRFSDDIFKPVDTEGYVKKVDNFTIIFDPSASMTEVYEPSYDCVACHIDYQSPGFSQNHAIRYGGHEFEGKDRQPFAMECARCHDDMHYSKFDFAQELSLALNSTIPDFELIGTLRTFGSPAYTNFSYGYKKNDNAKYLPYNRHDYGRAIEKIFEADGVSPLDMTLRATGKDWFERDGRIAVIVVSDGKNMDKREVFAAQDLKAEYGDRVCIYTILVGNDDNGKTIMEKISQAGKCGMAINGDHLLDAQNMNSFVREVFLEKRHMPKTIDGDLDGVPDCMDDCPDTLKGRVVSDNGCWNLVITADVLFDFDKYNLKPEGVTAMKQVYGMLIRYPYLKVHISGHTDNYGSMAYNIGLSKRRAHTGKTYLMEKGIDPARISLSWHSYTMPVATNGTVAGRALNRRLEFKFSRLRK